MSDMEPQGSPRPEPRVKDMEEKFPRALWVRLIVYVAVGHVFAAFVYMLFELGANNQ